MRDRHSPTEPPIDYPLDRRPPTPPIDYPLFDGSLGDSPVSRSRLVPIQRTSTPKSGSAFGAAVNGSYEPRYASTRRRKEASPPQPVYRAPSPLDSLRPDLRQTAEKVGSGNPAFLHHIRNHQLLNTTRVHRRDDCPICRAMADDDPATPPPARRSSVQVQMREPRKPVKANRWSYIPALTDNRRRQFL